MNDYRPPVTIGADVDVPEPFLKGPSAPVQQNVEEVKPNRKRPPKEATPTVTPPPGVEGNSAVDITPAGQRQLDEKLAAEAGGTTVGVGEAGNVTSEGPTTGGETVAQAQADGAAADGPDGGPAS